MIDYLCLGKHRQTDRRILNGSFDVGKVYNIAFVTMDVEHIFYVVDNHNKRVFMSKEDIVYFFDIDFVEAETRFMRDIEALYAQLDDITKTTDNVEG